jgi:hypothetical protein
MVNRKTAVLQADAPDSLEGGSCYDCVVCSVYHLHSSRSKQRERKFTSGEKGVDQRLDG